MKTALIVLGVLAFLFLFISIASSQLKILTVTGNSMYPAITENDVVVVALAKNENSETLGVHEGDVITYTLRVDEKEVLMTHRIVGIERNNNEVHLSTKGDNLSGVDKYVVTPSQVVGTVVLVIPFIGAFVQFANSVYGLVLLIIIPAVLIIAFEVQKIIKYQRAKQDKGF